MQFETIGHHTFEDRGKDDAKNAPYKCTDGNAFLGRGYYYWEDNLQLAKHWGGLRYIEHGKHYFVGESPISFDRDEFFDLIGDRKHQTYLLEISKMLTKKRPEKGTWPIGKVIEFLKASNIDPDGEFYDKFKFKLIRAVDDNFLKFKKNAKFATTQQSFTDLNPCYIICVTEKKGILLEPISIVHASKQAE